MGLNYSQIVEFYNKYKNEFSLFGFSDMSIEQISQFTGLSNEDAKFSKQRDFTEPFILKDESKLENLEKLANNHGIKITKGGRFYHLIGENQDKGKAVKIAIEIFQKFYGEEIYSLGLGDGENDIAMLENVKVPIIIKNHEDKYINVRLENIQKSTFKGSKGFNEMVLKNI